MIPFTKPYISGNEIKYIEDSLKGKLSGDGTYSKKCTELIQNDFGAEKVLLTTSCTHSLELAALALDIKEGDEVILPAYTFVSTANAFALRGAKPVFVDIRSDTLNIDESKIEGKITSKTKAIVPVHYAGVGCEMNKIMEIAKKHGLAVVEDAAQGTNAKYNGKHLGTIGDFGCYSFHGTKNYGCGEGGAILLNSQEFVEKVEVVREKGTNRSKFLKGEIDKYTWVDIGSSYLLSDILAAFLYAQLEERDVIKSKRKEIYDYYMAELGSLPSVELPKIPEECESDYHIFHLRARDEQERDSLINYLKQKGIQSNSHYVIPLSLSPMGRKYGYKEGDFPVAEDQASRIIRLPLFAGMSLEEREIVVSSVKEFYTKRENSP